MLKPVSHRPGGFTLIELMVVVILIGVVAAMVVPELGGSAETVRLDAAARRVSDMMDFCSKSATASGRVHALLFDQTARRFDVVCEPAPAPTTGEPGEAAGTPPAPGAGGQDGAPASGLATATPTPGASAAADTATSAGSTSTTNDQAAQLGLTRVSIPGFLDRTLPEGVGLSGLETYETDLSTGETEGQFKLLFFPDGTTEFAQVELSIPSGQRRVVALNGIGGTVSIFDPDRHGEIDMNTLVTDEDNPVETDGSDAATQPENGLAPQGPAGTPPGERMPGGRPPGDQMPGGRMPGEGMPGGRPSGDRMPAGGRSPAAGRMDNGGMRPDRAASGRQPAGQPAASMNR